MRSSLRPGLMLALVCATLAGAATGAGIRSSLALFTSTTTADGGTLSAGTWAVAVTYYLRNTVPPAGNTNALANLPATPEAPTETALHNYAADCFPAGTGRTLASTNGAQQRCRSVNWLTPPLASARTISTSVAMTAWWRLDNSDPGGKNIVVDVAVNDFNPATGTRTQIAAAPATTWQSGGVLTSHRITVPVSGYVVPAGHRVEIVVTGNRSTFAQRNVVVAYDTTAYPATLVLP